MRSPRKTLLAAAIAASLALPLLQNAHAVAADPATASTPAATATAAAATAAPTGRTAYDEVDHLAAAPATSAPAPAGGAFTQDAHVPGLPDTAGRPAPTAGETAGATVAGTGTTAAGVRCDLNGLTGLGPRALADFLADPAVTESCLQTLLWRWDARFATTMDAAHVQAVAAKAEQLAAGNDPNLYQLWYFLHAAVYHDFTRDEIDLTTPATTAPVQRAIDAYLAAGRAFEPTAAAGLVMRELANTATAPGIREHNLPLVKRILGQFGPGTKVADSWEWGGAAFSALNISYLGIYNRDQAFRANVAADADYRAAFRAFATAAQLKGTQNSWVARDAMNEYGRFSEISTLTAPITAEIGSLLADTGKTFGETSPQWIKVVGWANTLKVCQQFDVCTSKYEAILFPYTYKYDNGAIEVHTALDKATVDQMYYASKQVKSQFFRVLGTDTPLAGDPNDTLRIQLYPTRAAYEIYHPLLTGMGTENGGVYIERGATFYTYQRTTAESYLTLEELFRHEYVHYLNGRWATPGYFNDPRWYAGSKTTAMDEGTAEFFDGATRDQGVKVRQSLVAALTRDEANGIPRLSVGEVLHASYDDTPAFHFYNYAGTFFEFLWNAHPALLREMYAYQRADDPAGYDAWRTRLSADQNLNREYWAFLDEQIKQGAAKALYVPKTAFTANGYLKYAYPSEVRDAFAKATSNTPECKDNGDWDNKPMRFVCTGRITANLVNSTNPDQVIKDMSGTVDYFLLQRTKGVANNLDDMNCYFGKVDVWPGGQAGTADYTCEGPLRR
ncbi:MULTISPECIES: collagenase [Kitasatospora]|uniref:microbial collagenase n=1 Tax=Kitasatospora setae (strain ATCC 33774 / DSM 43861 / JCM 3304 / KCC A-0304 / NBRC 14216 / KM-6054) TaxID=452652 RepID=E4N2T0_KITSK|nr:MULTISPECIES: collagenase [Kitasatospora]BAJ32464.1 putative peptidase M09 family protein [Kitasatospora setae KM-6054]